MIYLLDTNVVSELRKAGDGKADRNVVHWLSSIDAATLYVSVVTLMEIELGILLLERRDPNQGSRLRSWMTRYVLPEFEHRTVVIDRNVALRCASLHVPDPRPERDALIAATAFVHGMTVVTRNTEDFTGTAVLLLNPWDTQPETRLT